MLSAFTDRVDPRPLFLIGMILLVLSVIAYVEGWSIEEHKASTTPSEPSICWPHGCNA